MVRFGHVGLGLVRVSARWLYGHRLVVVALAVLAVLTFLDLAPLGPDSLLLIGVLLAACVVLLWRVGRARHLATKVACGLVVIVLAMAAGIVEVNRYYGYYTSWSAMIDDLSGAVPGGALVSGSARSVAGRSGHFPAGRIESVWIDGSASHIDRAGLVYLPPQYDEPRYAHVTFPAVELLHGSPGHPTDWIYALHVQRVLNQLIDRRVMGPVVAVMPAIDDGNHYEDCVNGKGFADETYIAQDVPAFVRSHYRVSSDPSEWGIGGYSSGGYCTANLALQHPSWFGAAAIMDGYYRATEGPAAAALGDNPAAEAANSPLYLAQRLHPGAAPLPAFWVAAGTGDRGDYLDAQAFVAAMRGIEHVSLAVDPGAVHNFYAWAAQLPDALSWMWQQLAPPDLRTQFPLSGSPTSVYVRPHMHPGVPRGGTVQPPSGSSSEVGTVTGSSGGPPSPGPSG